MLKIPHPGETPPDPLERLPENLRTYLREHGTPYEYTTDDVIMPPRDPGDRIRVMVMGEARVVQRDGVDEEVTIDILKPGDMFGEISYLTGMPSPPNTEVIADEYCEVLEISAAEFDSILRANPDFTLSLVKNLARKIVRLGRQTYESKQKKRALQSLISREEHIFPDYVLGDHVRRHLAPRLRELAESDGPVLIIGETGVGKEVLAHSIFRMSRHFKGVFLLLDMMRTRSEGPFTDSEPGNGGPEGFKDVVTDQLKLFFGSEEENGEAGHKETPGYIELTEDGTLLVRSIDQLAPFMQEKLLAAVTTGVFTRYGGKRPLRARMRLIATTTLEPSQITPESHPLLYGLMDRSVSVPPLKKRRREIPGLVEHYLAQYSQQLRRPIPELTRETLKTLVNYSWPGNDMELSSTLKRALLTAEGGLLNPQDIYFDLKRVEGHGKLNLLKFQPVRQAVRSPLFPALFQSAVTPFFFILLVLLFLGPADLMRNPAALFSWAVGWPVLIIGAFAWSRFWCSLCPIGTLSKLAKKVISLERPFPQWLKNWSDVIIVASVILIIWFEVATNIRNSPFNVGLLLVTILMVAVMISVVYERQSWCRYLCGLGGMIGILAKGSPVELRADRNVCIAQCNSNECYVGTETREGCPFGQVGPKLHSNRFCKLCGQCVKNCPHGAITLNLRIPGREIWEMRHTNAMTAFLIVGMFGGLMSEMLHLLPAYQYITGRLMLPELLKFTVFFLGVLLGVNLLLVLSTALSYRTLDDTFAENFSRYGLSLLPVTLNSFIAFHLYYLINLGVQLPILVSETFQFEIFRTLIIAVPGSVTLFILRALLWIGFAWSASIMYRIARTEDEPLLRTLRGILPHVLLALAMVVLMHYTMEWFFFPHGVDVDVIPVP